jgi:dienelactone hydrolase
VTVDPFEIVATEDRDGASIHDIRVLGPDADPDAAGGPIEAFLVEPADGADPAAAPGQAGPGLLFAHWYEPNAENGNRTQYLAEAATWAQEHGATSILPQLTFPWHGEPDGAAHDRARIETEVARLRRCLDVLVARPGVDAARIGVVGHDFGAMHGLLLAPLDGRPAAYVFIAGVPRWGDWFLPFWKIEDDRIDYLRALRDLDPIEHLREIPPGRLLFQFGSRDWFIPGATGFELRRAAHDGTEVKTYDTDHAMESADAEADRAVFLTDAFASVSGSEPVTAVESEPG